MSDWQVGDLAVCVDDTPDCFGEAVSLSAGGVYRVREVIGPMHSIKYGHGLGLNFAEAPTELCGWASDRFRKIRPDKHEACEDEFLTLLNRTKRTVKA